MRVNFISRAGPHLASYRLRIEKPAEYLRHRGWDVEVGEYCPADVHIFPKHWQKESVLEWARKSPCPIIDICDDYFDDPEHGDYYREMVSLSKEVICSSWGLREKAGRGVVIHEPYEFPEGKAKHPKGNVLLWFGHRKNIQTLRGYPPDGWKLIVCSNVDHPIVFWWSRENLQKCMKRADLVIIPKTEDWKSPNRIVEAIRGGLFVVADDIPSYRGFGMKLGDITEGLEWVKQQKDLRPQIRAAQSRVRDLFSPERIGEQWYDCISAVAGNIGKDGSTLTSTTPALTSRQTSENSPLTTTTQTA